MDDTFHGVKERQTQGSQRVDFVSHVSHLTGMVFYRRRMHQRLHGHAALRVGICSRSIWVFLNGAILIATLTDLHIA
jgi:hypothetical protein